VRAAQGILAPNTDDFGNTMPLLFPQQLAFDSRWVPPVGGAPSRHTGTGGATAGVHAQCLRDLGDGDKSLVVPLRAAARPSLVVPRAAARR
jgi:hypothetical protein